MFVVFDEPDPEADDVAFEDAFADGLAVARAIAPPPPTSTPETINAASPFLMWCRIWFTSSRVRSTHSNLGNCGCRTRGL